VKWGLGSPDPNGGSGAKPPAFLPAAARRSPVFGLDVIRATAVSLVLLSHGSAIFAGWLHAPDPHLFSYGAYYGIQFFFVLSGFLIGGLLIEQLDRPEPPPLPRAWGIFMLRRWLRTLPLYYLWIVVLTLLWAPIIWPDSHRSLDALWRYGLLLQNLAWPMRDGNFFDVSWSLAVEEWFYLGFSVLLFAIAARARKLALPLATTFFIAGPLLLRWWLRAEPDTSDHLVIYWLDQIGIGVIVAIIAARRPAWFRAAAWLLPLGLALVWLSYNGGLARFGVSAHWRRTLDFDLVGIALALILPAATLWQKASGPLAAAIRWISRTSYALYITHLSVLIWVTVYRGRWHLSAGASIALSIGLIFAISWAISRYVERPIMRRRPDDRPRQNPQTHQPPSAASASPPTAEAAQA
jgi:peptidoglycan/LPS O-acetylase OafA/YrhL